MPLKSCADIHAIFKNNEYFMQPLKWERVNYLYNIAIKDANPDNLLEATLLQETAYKKDIIELEMQRSQILL